MSEEQKRALEAVARAFGWHKRSLDEMGLILWCAFHYYVQRLPIK